MPQINNYQSMM